MNEQFSAFLDGEATRDEADSVINALRRDQSLRDSWTRQHWLRTTLRAPHGESAAPLDDGFATRVMAAIAEQGDTNSAAAATPGATVTSIVAKTPARHARPRRRWRSMAGMAAVASATGIVLLVSNPLQRGDGTPGGNDTIAGTTAAASPATASGGGFEVDQLAANAMPVSDIESDMLRQAGPNRAAIQQGPADHWSVSDPDLEDELNGYLVEHNGLARGYGMSGTPGFIRVATYGQETPQ